MGEKIGACGIRCTLNPVEDISKGQTISALKYYTFATNIFSFSFLLLLCEGNFPFGTKFFFAQILLIPYENLLTRLPKMAESGSRLSSEICSTYTRIVFICH